MAVMDCPNCGHMVSETARACPGCGQPPTVCAVAATEVAHNAEPAESVPDVIHPASEEPSADAPVSQPILHRSTNPRTLWIVVAAFVVGMLLTGFASLRMANQVTQLQSELAGVTAERDTMKTELDPVRRAEEASRAAETAAAKAAAEAKAAEDAKAKAATDAAAAEARANTFTDGTYLVGTDLPAGRYKGIPEGGSAYWQISSDANGDKIIANNNSDGPFYVDVKAGQYLEISRTTITRVK